MDFSDLECETQRGTVKTFDYCLAGDEGFAIERKSLPDLIGSITRKSNFERELRKIQRAREAGMPRIYYVIEANFQDIQNYDFPFSSRITPQFCYKRWRYLAYNVGVRFIWAGDPEGAAKAVHLLLKSRHEHLTRGCDVVPEDHAKFSPSSLTYREQCPSYQPGVGGLAAEEGTMMHYAAETGDFTQLNDEQAAQVEECLSYVDSLLHSGGKLLREVKVEIPDVTWGTTDVLIVNKDEIHLVDYKFGRLPVPDAEINVQGWAYLLGAWEREETKGIDKATIHFLLPRRDEMSVHTFSREADYDRMYDRVCAIVARCEAGVDERKSGVHCRYCAGKATCPVFLDHALMLPAKTGVDLKKMPSLTDVASLRDPEVVAQVLDAVPMIEDWAKQVRSHALDLVQKQGVELPGYSMVSRSAGRKITDAQAAYDVASELGVPVEDFLPCCSIAIGEFDAAIRRHAPKRMGKKNCEMAHQKLAGLGVETSDGEIEYLKKATK